MRRLIILSLLFLGACQTPPKPAPTQTWDEFIRDHPSKYIQGRTEQLAAERLRLERLGLAQDTEAVRALVDANLPPGHYASQEPGATAAILRRHRVDTITHQLIEFGYRGHDFSDPFRAKQLVEIVARAGSPEKGDGAILSPTVVLGDFVRVQTEPADGNQPRFSSIVYRVVEPLKNGPPVGSLIRVPGGPTYYGDGTMGMSTADIETIKPGRYVLFLSRQRLPTAESADRYRRVFGTLREFNGRFGPTGESSYPEVTLDDLRAAVRDPLCASRTRPSTSTPSQSC